MNQSPEPKERFLMGVLLFAAAVMMAIMALPFYSGSVYNAVDLWGFYMPVRWFYAQCIAHGHAPYWFPGQFSGYYLHGTGQVGMCHPLHYVLYKYLPFVWAFDIEVALSYPVMFTGMYLFMRRRSADRLAAVAAALLFTFSTFNIHRLVHLNALAIIAHYPWVLYFLDQVLRSERRRVAHWSAVAFGLLQGSEILLGYPQYFWYSSLLCVGYVILLFATGQLRWPRLGMAIAAGVVGILTGGAALLPTFYANSISVRQMSKDWSEDEANGGATMPEYLTQAFNGYSLPVSHKARIYFGAVNLLLVAWAIARWRALGSLKPLVALMVAMIILSVWMSLGYRGYLYYLQTALPVIKEFRYPSRYYGLMTFATSIMGGVAFADLVRFGQERRRIPPVVWGLLGVIVLLSIAVTGYVFARNTLQVQKSSEMVAVGMAVFLVAAVLIWRIARGDAWAAPLIIVLAMVDVGYYGFGYALFDHTYNIDEQLSKFEAPPDNDKSYRIVSGLLDDLVPSSMLGWKRIDGHEGLPPFRRLDYRDLAALRVAGVRWVHGHYYGGMISGFVDNYEIFDTRKTYSELPKIEGSPWRELKGALPRARLVGQFAIADDKVNNWAEELRKIDVDRAALVESKQEIAEDSTATARVTADDPGRIVVEIHNAQPQLLLLTESYDKGWIATSDDGKPLPVLRVNGDFLGCRVEPNQGTVTFTYDPPNLRKGIVISLVACGLLAAWGLAATFLIRDPRGSAAQLGQPTKTSG